METCYVWFAFLIVFCQGSVGQFYDSPCPGEYEVVFDGAEWYGIVQVPYNFTEYCQTLMMEFSTDKEINTSVQGWIELTGTREKVWGNFVAGKNLKYKIHFPNQEKVPDIKNIIINNQLICINNNAERKVENNLKLRHYFYIGNDIKITQCFEKKPENEGFYVNKNGTVMHFGLLKTKNNNPPQQNKKEAATYEFNNYCGRTENRDPLKNRVHDDKDWPWLVAIYLKNIRGLDFLCTGTLISNKHILTAAHCLKEKGNKPLTTSQILIKLGQSNLLDWANPLSKMSSAEYFHFHDEFDYNLGFNHDLAIIEIKPITFTRNILPICLTNPKQNNYILNYIKELPYITVGWKFDLKMQLDNPSSQQSVVHWIQGNQCVYNNPQFKTFFDETFLCSETTENAKLQSYGSGTYTWIDGRWFLIGVHSMNLKNSSIYNIYQDIPLHHNWIKQIVYK